MAIILCKEKVAADSSLSHRYPESRSRQAAESGARHCSKGSAYYSIVLALGSEAQSIRNEEKVCLHDSVDVSWPFCDTKLSMCLAGLRKTASVRSRAFATIADELFEAASCGDSDPGMVVFAVSTEDGGCSGMSNSSGLALSYFPTALSSSAIGHRQSPGNDSRRFAEEAVCTVSLVAKGGHCVTEYCPRCSGTINSYQEGQCRVLHPASLPKLQDKRRIEDVTYRCGYYNPVGCAPIYCSKKVHADPSLCYTCPDPYSTSVGKS